MNAYLIAFGGLLLLAGRLGDLFGRRRVFVAGLAIFTLASLACGLARSQEVLVVARFVQGIGGALTSAVVLGMIITMFPEPREREGDRRLLASGLVNTTAQIGAALVAVATVVAVTVLRPDAGAAATVQGAPVAVPETLCPEAA